MAPNLKKNILLFIYSFEWKYDTLHIMHIYYVQKILCYPPPTSGFPYPYIPYYIWGSFPMNHGWTDWFFLVLLNGLQYTMTLNSEDIINYNDIMVIHYAISDYWFLFLFFVNLWTNCFITEIKFMIIIKIFILYILICYLFIFC